MLVVFLLIFVADTIIIFVYNYVTPLNILFEMIGQILMYLSLYVFLQHFESVLVVICFILSKICSLSNQHLKCH